MNQLSKNNIRKKKKKKKLGILKGNPQRKGICIKIYQMRPKKPNSARRNVCKVKFNNGDKGIVFIPGEKHTLELFGRVLVRGGRTQDVPGLKLKAIRGKFDLGPVVGRTRKRSKYGRILDKKSGRIHPKSWRWKEN